MEGCSEVASFPGSQFKNNSLGTWLEVRREKDRKKKEYRFCLLEIKPSIKRAYNKFNAHSSCVLLHGNL